MHAIFGGKNPHPQSLVVGGVTSVADMTPDRIAEFLYITKETQDFVKNVYIPDLVAVASFYKDWGAIGGTTNFLAWGDPADIPAWDKIVGQTHEWHGTSVIFAAMGKGRP